ncbi:hypothetical protein PSHT_07653 [Puccinia striiformis]|uniref:Uncharacterized protein n=2 Tax=Puccinia striiformis TaxID=27350 RepID=A0A0L0VA65_9BASI|nr:hypothetical protein H4Q26_009948 [Puccinia striiformis f. sp. tritici PST-130]KNE96185.1 hypothetical protein PSTG_10600 [Puccinia striiformis f. sp. tritici PST-78]POW13727.1 hypothetical protein PSHT_07653 [Puccinia striiformis]
MDSHLAVVLVSSQLHRPPNLLQTILALQVTSVSLTFGHQAAKPSAPLVIRQPNQVQTLRLVALCQLLEAVNFVNHIWLK